MRFLIDENIPLALLRKLEALGHETKRVTPGSTDIDNAKTAKLDKRILITLDKDLANTFIFPPKEFNTILLDIHPPYKDKLIEALLNALKTLPPDKFTGLVIINESGSVRIAE